MTNYTTLFWLKKANPRTTNSDLEIETNYQMNKTPTLPSFMFQGDFLQNLRHIDFGIRHCGTPVNDVVLPPWAKSPADFVEKLSQALESDYVSR